MGLKITITGKVHDVGYRLFLLELADSLFIERFDARNVRIGGKQAVVVLVDGDEGQLKEFVELVKSEKPEMAVVEEIKVEEYKGRIRDIERFRASFNTAQLSKIVQVGLKMLEKMDTMLEKQDKMLEKQDEMLKKQDSMLQKQDETIREIRATREELKSEIRAVGGKVDKVAERVGEVSKKIDKTNELLEKRFEKLEEEIERIKKALIKAGIDI